MKLKAKFLMMVAITSLVLIVVSAMGYFYAKSQVEANIKNEMFSVANTYSNQLDGWLLAKAQTAVTTSENIRAVLGDKEIPVSFVQNYKADSSLLDLYAGLEDGRMIDGSGATLPDGYDPRKRGWYQKTKEKNKLGFTDAYVDAFTKKYIVSAGVPLKNEAGNFRGVVGIDISLDILSEKIKDVKVNGKGYGTIIDQQGIVLAHPDAAQVSKNINEDPVLQKFTKEMLAQDKGMQSYEVNGIEKLMIYTKIPATGWIMAITVDAKDVYGQVTSLGYQFGITALLGILLSIVASWKLSSGIAKNIAILSQSAQRLAEGDLMERDLRIHTSDEIGKLAEDFSTMTGNLRNLIKAIAQTAEHVAASSEELTASAEQSAHVSTQVATSITEVAQGAEQQLQAIDETSAAVEDMSESIQCVVTNAATVNVTSQEAAVAAEQGNKAVFNAVSQMNIIEKTILGSAGVVSKLGERSKEIGQIVDTISGIAGQTNLLALNAAIEAARAGEQGRGFAVVAEEVRKLAEQSQQAAKQIADMINEIQADTKEAVAAMNDGTREVEIGNEVVSAAGAAFKQIELLIGQVVNQVQQITNSIGQMKTGSQKIVTAVQDIECIMKNTSGETQTISAATEEQSASMQEIASSSHALADMAAELQQEVRKFSI
ncbi:methyl-accepting chemotaxis protein [Pelosinus propionicus]|uniref:Methyl-accepting chemotaxis sensory transducer with Cache sensor n=1 Tax=Pelosinus propionicus DSM 13327 TaxID=1123291 RepID=A0A1I4H1K4_9FIRM|nr:methyl-accepting chemotaxis protein [Pelosinus propionicus]SFL35563.1 methyl-accepting chemotaxis sensory transducer with Cache sensor [Pelosinus propionicus DSM 13327]